MYDNINKLSGPVYRSVAYYDTDVNYNIEYHCDAVFSAKKREKKRRVRRIRYSIADNTFVDTSWAINTIDSSRSDYEKSTADFIFDAIEATVKALDYDYSDDLTV